ncbi:MAG: hypothetical protein ABL977_08885 [Candidatus Eisenbacteria bacterium]
MRVAIPLFLFLASSSLLAAPEAVARGAGATRAAVVSDTAALDVNDLRLFISNNGMLPWVGNAEFGTALEFPKGSGQGVLFAGGPWIAAKVGGEIRAAVSEYSTEYGPGAILPGGAADRADKPEYRVYRLDRRHADSAARDAQLAAYAAGAVPHGAPPVAVLPDGSLDILGDEMLWTVYNDADPALHTNQIGASAPLGLELSQTAWAFHQPGALDRVIFLRLQVTNKGANTLDSTFIAYWTDPDLSSPFNDLVGADVPRRLVYVYDATLFPGDPYGAAVPSMAVQLLSGVHVGGVDLGMTSGGRQRKNTFEEDPFRPGDLFRRLAGFKSSGEPFKDPVSGATTKYVCAGDPITGSGWIDDQPADRRMLLSMGPFTMLPGDTQTVVLALIVGQGSNRLGSIGVMRQAADRVRDLWEHGMVVPVRPPAPGLRATPADGGVVLTWDASAERAVPDAYAFQGYTLYQGPSPAGPFLPIATFDRVDGVRAITEERADPNSGLVLPVVVAQGADTGLAHSWLVARDSLHSAPLVNGQRYWFGLDAYSASPGRAEPVQRSAMDVVEVVPQPPAGGIVSPVMPLSAVARGQRTAGSEPTTDRLNVAVVDTLALRDAQYEVGFMLETSGDTTWYMVRDPEGPADTVLSHVSFRPRDSSGPTVDGFSAWVTSSAEGALAEVGYESSGPPPLVGVDRFLEFLDGGADYAARGFNGSSIPPIGARTHYCEVRFTGGEPGQFAYRYRDDFVGIRIQDYVSVPFTVWDLTANIQLSAAFIEQAGAPTDDGRWAPDDSPSGGREFLWILDRPYSGNGTPDPAYFLEPDLMDISSGKLDARYFAALRATVPGATARAGDRLRFRLTRASGPNDLFRFTTHAATRAEGASARSALERVLAVPNPYFLFSSYERTGSERIVRFTHLPVHCTIRLFDVAGSLVRVLEKNDDRSQAVWDLTNQAGRRVGSGIYIFHVDAPGVGTHIGKLAVLQR